MNSRLGLAGAELGGFVRSEVEGGQRYTGCSSLGKSQGEYAIRSSERPKQDWALPSSFDYVPVRSLAFSPRDPVWERLGDRSKHGNSAR